MSRKCWIKGQRGDRNKGRAPLLEYYKHESHAEKKMSSTRLDRWKKEAKILYWHSIHHMSLESVSIRGHRKRARSDHTLKSPLLCSVCQVSMFCHPDAQGTLHFGIQHKGLIHLRVVHLWRFHGFIYLPNWENANGSAGLGWLEGHSQDFETGDRSSFLYKTKSLVIFQN